MSVADIKQVRSMAGEGYAQIDGVGHFATLGHLEAFNVNVEVTTEDLKSAISGIPRKEDVEVTDEIVSGDFTMRESGVRQLAMAFMAKDEALVQTARTAQTMIGSAKAGDVVDLGALGTTVTSINAGGSALEEGEDYTHESTVGMVTFLKDTEYNIAYSSAAITESSNRKLIAVLSRTGGILARLRLVQRPSRRGKSVFLWEGLVRMFPSGPIALHNDNGDKATVAMRFDVIEDKTKPVGQRFSTLKEIPVPNTVS